MFTVVGLRHVVSKKDGVKYVEIHTESDDRFVDGYRCDVFFVRLDMIDRPGDLVVGSVINVAFNRIGRVDSVSIV